MARLLLLPLLLIRLLLAPASAQEDVRDLVNAWKREYNEALALRAAGQSLAALDAAGRALGLASASERHTPAALYAELAAELGDYPLAFNTLDPLVGDPKVPWQVWWNASVTARDAEYPATALRYAREATRRHPRPAEAAPLLLGAAMVSQEWALALEAERLLPAKAELELRSALVRELVEAHRCEEARAVAARLPLDPEREERVGGCG